MAAWANEISPPANAAVQHDSNCKVINGTRRFEERFAVMSLPSPVLMENAVQIAWDYLERTGQIEDAAFTSRFLQTAVEEMIRRGEQRQLLLSNKAIAAYERQRKERSAA